MPKDFFKDSSEHHEGDEATIHPLHDVRELIGNAVIKYCGDDDQPAADDLFNRALQEDPAAARGIMTEIADAIGTHSPDDPLVKSLRHKLEP